MKRELTRQLVREIAEAAFEKAESLGVSMTVSVVNAEGRLLYAVRGDGTGFFTMETSKAKAIASAAFGQSTQDIGALAEGNPRFWNGMPHAVGEPVLPTTGAVPIRLDGRLVGAIGCGGGAPEVDHECALAGAAVVSG